MSKENKTRKIRDNLQDVGDRESNTRKAFKKERRDKKEKEENSKRVEENFAQLQNDEALIEQPIKELQD